jgi:predicted nucleic acid-binding protein
LIYVLDASAILRYLDDGPGAARVEACIARHIAHRDRIAISAIQWGEIAGILLKRHGLSAAEESLTDLQTFDFDLVPATPARARRAGFLGRRLKIPYADAFAVELASDSPDRTLLTADYDFKPAAREVKIEFLPSKPNP